MTPPVPPLNESALKALESLLKFEQLQSLIQDHLTASSQKLAKIQTCVQQHDWAELGCIAHDVVSTSANFGMEAVLDPARRLEAACLAKNLDAALAEVVSLQTLLPAQLSLLAQRYDLDDRMTAPPSL